MKIGLFIPCYVDALYPEVGVATYKLLKKLGLDVEYPEKQTCCGQPMGNAGFQNKAAKLVETMTSSLLSTIMLWHPALLVPPMLGSFILTS